MLSNLVLIGFMGSGKSSVGRRLAEMTGHRFLDTDHRVSTRTGSSISSIFARHGEEYFRDLETEILEELLGVCGIVLATGGGIVLREKNRELLHRIGTVVWLDADPDTIFERVRRNTKRPLLRTEDPRKTFDELREARLPIYEEAADLRIDSTGLGHAHVAQEILRSVCKLQAANSPTS